VVTWTNWSGSVTCAPRRIELPEREDAIQEMVRWAAAADAAVRVAGTGHSFVPIVATDGVLLSLDRWTGVESTAVAEDGRPATATVRAGTKLHALGEELLALGLAMENLGDVDVQALAGAVSTATHGTGPRYGNISTQVAGLRLVTAAGDVLAIDERGDRDLYLAARVSLGMLGVISAVTLRLRPAFRLHERVWVMPMAACFEEMDALIATNERFEFFWSPVEDTAECKTLNQTGAEPEAVAGREGERVGWSNRILPSVRERKFNEMEYSLPAEQGPDCLRAVQRRMRERHPAATWRVQYRTVAADDAFLSPNHGRATVAISIHHAAHLAYDDYFFDIEPIFRAHGGRPHWGKVHSLGAADLRALYPRYDDFRAVRDRLDPAGRFLNPWLRRLFATD
jgi:FAD/FMN-containing dehydrogenase